jgi:hypothetical protein
MSMYLHVYACLCIVWHASVSICACADIHALIHGNTYMLLCIGFYYKPYNCANKNLVNVCSDVDSSGVKCARIQIYIHTYVCMYVCVCLNVCVYIYIYNMFIYSMNGHAKFLCMQRMGISPSYIHA